MSRELRELAERLSRYGVRFVVLFGSRARGDYTDESNVDVLVVADELPDDPREAYDVVRRLAPGYTRCASGPRPSLEGSRARAPS